MQLRKLSKRQRIDKHKGWVGARQIRAGKNKAEKDRESKGLTHPAKLKVPQ